MAKGTDTDTGTDMGTDMGTDTGTDTGTYTGTDTGTDAGADMGTDTGTDMVSDTGTDTGTDIGTDTGADIAINIALHFSSPAINIAIGTLKSTAIIAAINTTTAIRSALSTVVNAAVSVVVSPPTTTAIDIATTTAHSTYTGRGARVRARTHTHASVLTLHECTAHAHMHAHAHAHSHAQMRVCKCTCPNMPADPCTPPCTHTCHPSTHAHAHATQCTCLPHPCSCTLAHPGTCANTLCTHASVMFFCLARCQACWPIPGAVHPLREVGRHGPGKVQSSPPSQHDQGVRTSVATIPTRCSSFDQWPPGGLLCYGWRPQGRLQHGDVATGPVFGSGCGGAALPWVTPPIAPCHNG